MHMALHPVLTGLAALLAGCAAAPPASPPPSLQTRADAVLHDVQANADFAGAVVLMRGGQVVYEKAVGLAQRSPDRPFTTSAPSDGGSLAKTLTAAAVWELAAEGRLSLDDLVTRHVPEHPYPGHSVRQLVPHRNGLPDCGVFDADFAPGPVRDTTDLLRAVPKRQPQPVFARGVQVAYSNLGFDTAALVVERITGKRIEAWWRERYFGPLGLHDMFARTARFADWPVPRTMGYRREGREWVLNDAFDGEAFIGASNVQASARDWARWGDGFASGRVMAAMRLQAGLQEAMLDSGLPDRLTRLTRLSWYCDASLQRCHYTGAYNGFFAQVYWHRATREVVAWVSNSTVPPSACARLTRDLLDVLAGRAPATEAAPVLTAAPKAERARWAGTYVSATTGRLIIDVTADGRSFLRVNDGERVSLFALPEGVFYAPMLDLWLGFTGLPDGPTLHIRSVFHVAEARRQAAPGGLTK